MKFRVSKITSVTLLASMMMSAVSPPALPVMAYGSETEMGETAAVETAAETYVMALPETEIQATEIQATENTEESASTPEKVTEHVETAAEEERQMESKPPETAEKPKESETKPDEPKKIIKQEEATEGQTEKKETESDTEPKEETKVEEPVKVKLELEPSEVTAECPDPQQAGLPQKLKVSVNNPTEEDAELRFYFWDYSGEETDGKNIPDEVLTEACGDVRFPSCDADNRFPVVLTGENGSEAYGEFWMREELEDGELAARYLEVDIPAGYAFSESFPVVNDLAETVVVSASIYPEGADPKFDKFAITWKETAEEKEQEPEPGQPETEVPETELPETETPETDTESETDGGSEPAEETSLSEKETGETEQQDQDEAVLSQPIPENLNAEDFASRRLLVMVKDEKKILETDSVIGSYEDIYLIEYETVERCMAAYVYYSDVADAVEPDVFMEIASDETAEETEEVSAEKENNPVTALSNMEGASFLPDGKARVIALLDTGASLSGNVVDRVSLIDDALEGHSHGNAMVSAITGQNPDAKVLSVRVMGNDGRGTVSAIVAGMEYAMEHGASIINLSLSSKKNLLNAVLEAEIQKAASMGIIIVGAAGNNGADVMDYMPGSVEEAYIVGACNENGVRISSSNYGTTVDYNVIAGTTSEAAAKFSGCVSRAGIDAVKVNEGIVYATDYVAAAPDDDETESPETEDDWFTEEELADMAGGEEDGRYPGKGSSISQTHKIWTRDTGYDFTAYNPYHDDENVSVACISEIPESAGKNGEKVQAEYTCSLKDDENYRWNLFVTFEYTDDRSLATEGSSMLERLMPSAVNQERNAGYGGIVPEYTGETVAGREFTVLKDNEDFDVYGLLIDYNPETFKVNNLADDGGFDVTRPGTYTVTYEMSYFLYPDYTWYVANKVNVVERESLEPGIYLTSSESTLMFRRNTDSHYSGYGDLVKIEPSGEIFTVACIDPDYEVDFSSSPELVTSDICELTDKEDGTKDLAIAVPEGLEEPVILSMYRPGYQSAKFFTGGGWADGEEFNIEELAVDQMTDTDVEHLEDTVLGKVDEDDDEYMEIAETWTNVESKNISGRVTTGVANTMNNSWVSGRVGGCNTGTAQVSEKREEIDAWITEKGYNVDSKELDNFSISCSSGHDYLGLWPNSSYSATFQCFIQKNGDDYRLRITCSLHPGSDSHGNYQSFYGSKTYSSLTNGARLRIYKRFAYPEFMDVNPNKYGYLKTTFAIYPASAYNKTTKMLDTTVTPAGTIILNDKEDDTVYGDSDILDPGTYYVIETRRIAGCTQNTDIYGPVVIKETDSGVVKLYEKVNNADYASMASNNWIYNYPMYFTGKILTKTDDSGLPVKGAIYKVEYSIEKSADAFSPTRTWYFKTDAKGILSYDYEHYVASFTYNGKKYQSDAIIENSGKTMAMLPFGFVRMKEIMPPSDIYDVDPNTYTIELVAQKDAAGAYTIRKLAVKGNIPTSVDKLRYWKLTVEKASKASPEVLGLKSYSLAGATFGVFSDQACTKRVQLYSDEKLTAKVADNVFRTDDSGKTPTYYLKTGSGSATYYVKELTAPDGHQLADSPVPVKVTMPADALKLKKASFTEGFSEPYDFMELDALVEKLSMHGNPVQGVVFKVCYYDDSSANAGQLKKTWYLVSDEQGKVYMDEKHLYDGDASMKSDPFYTDPSSGKVILPIGGYVTMQEVKAPAQYQIDDTVQGFITKKQKVTVKRLYNDMVPGKIRLKKYDKTGAKPLEGVQFELKFVKAAEKDTDLASAYTRLLSEGETTILTTDKNGEIAFDNLDHGTYEITEVKTVPGQTLLKDKITVEIPITMTKAEAEEYGNVDFTSAKEDTGYTGKWFFYDCLYEITNEPQFHLPQTGGFGGWKYGFIGVAVMFLAGGILVFGRKKKKLTV